MRLKKLLAALPVVCLLAGLTASVPANARLAAQDKDGKPKKEKKDKSDKKSKKDKDDNQSPTVSDRETRNVMWTEPTDIESRDLFYGPEGQAGAPDPNGKFTFEKRDTGGTSEKIHVTDDKGRKWNVKFGPEAKPETAASRIAWAVGYHVDQNYFVKRTHIEGRGGFDIWDVRFKRRDDGTKNVGLWDWHANPFLGTRELQGYKTLMVLLNNWDLKTVNNKIIRASKKSGGDRDVQIYYVSDLGATLGSTGSIFTKFPGFGNAPAGTKGDPDAFAGQAFIEGVRNGQVVFHYKGKDPKALEGVTVENARWMGDLLGRLSDKQLADAFRAGGFTDAEVITYVKATRSRINQLKNLK
jgi:hypothetical protein